MEEIKIEKENIDLEHSKAIADEIEKFDFMKEYPGRTMPRAVTSIIKFLREGDIKSARLTFNWESDKIMSYAKLFSLLKEKLGK